MSVLSALACFHWPQYRLLRLRNKALREENGWFGFMGFMARMYIIVQQKLIVVQFLQKSTIYKEPGTILQHKRSCRNKWHVLITLCRLPQSLIFVSVTLYTSPSSHTQKKDILLFLLLYIYYLNYVANMLKSDENNSKTYIFIISKGFFGTKSISAKGHHSHGKEGWWLQPKLRLLSRWQK